MPYDPALDTQAAGAAMGFSPSAPPEPTGMWHNFWSGSATELMQSMAKLGRSASMAAGAVPVALDAITDPESMLGQAVGEHGLSDRYFKWHDEHMQKAVDYWTPRPAEVGMAGQVVGQFAGGMAQFLANPALAVGSAYLSTAEDLQRQGVGTWTAQGAGAIAATGQAVGYRAPAAIGNTLLQRLGSGAAINVLQGGVAAGATNLLLRAGGAPDEVRSQFNPLDVAGRSVDALLGLGFGGMAHLQDAVMVQRAAQALEDGALPGKPMSFDDLYKGVENTKAAIDQLARGAPVDVPFKDVNPGEPRATEPALHVEPEPTKPPIERPPMDAGMAQAPPEPKVEGQPKPEAPPRFDDSVRLPTGEYDPKTGEAASMSANDVIAKAEADAARAKETAPGLFQTAAECLLGLL